MSFFSTFFKAVATAASAVINVAVEATKAIIETATAIWNDSGSQADMKEAKNREERADDELTEINDELQLLLKRYKERGSLSGSQKRRAEYLRDRRNELKEQITEVGELRTTQDIAENTDDFEHISIDDDHDHAHIIQGNVGVSTYGKLCPNCQRDMVIQWQRDVTTASVNDFFWGCSGWYVKMFNGSQACRTTIPLSKNDLDIFAKTDSLESKINNNELSELILLPEPQKIITERMEDLRSDKNHLQDGAELYRCPTHGEKLILRKKKQATGLLDQYFLGCPKWKPNDLGCGYIVKLKSPMQLTTLLKQETGSGIL